jgi:hypothetical protein
VHRFSIIGTLNGRGVWILWGFLHSRCPPVLPPPGGRGNVRVAALRGGGYRQAYGKSPGIESGGLKTRDRERGGGLPLPVVIPTPMARRSTGYRRDCPRPCRVRGGWDEDPIESVNLASMH